MGFTNLRGMRGLAALAVMARGMPRKKPSPRRYSSFCGPPYPNTRQQRRALERKSTSALASLKHK